MNSATELKVVEKMRRRKSIERLVDKFEYTMMYHVFSLRTFREKKIGVEGEKKG